MSISSLSRSCSSSSSLSEYICNSSWLDYAVQDNGDGSNPDVCNYAVENIDHGSYPDFLNYSAESIDEGSSTLITRFVIRCADAIRSPNNTSRAVAISGRRVFTAHQSGDGRHLIKVWLRRQASMTDDYFSDIGTKLYGTGLDTRHKLVATLPTARERFTKSLNQKNYVQIRRHHKQLWVQHADAISSLAVDDSRRLLFSGSWDKTVKVWDIDHLRCVESISAHDDAVNALAVSQTHGFLYTASADGSIKVWRQRHFSKKLKHVLVATLSGGHQPESAVNAVVLSDDGEFLFSAASDGAICVWGKSKGQLHISKLLHSFQNVHRLPILCLSYIRNGVGDRLLLSGSADKTIKAWCLTGDDEYSPDKLKNNRMECVGVLEGHGGAVRSIAISDDGEMRTAAGAGAGVVVYSGSSDGATRIWWLARVSSAFLKETTL